MMDIRKYIPQKVRVVMALPIFMPIMFIIGCGYILSSCVSMTVDAWRGSVKSDFRDYIYEALRK